MIDGLCFARRESVTQCVGLWCVGMGRVCVKERLSTRRIHECGMVSPIFYFILMEGE